MCNDKLFFDIDIVIKELKEKRKIFTSEADFQLALAQTIMLCYPEARVRLEYCPQGITETITKEKMYIDILVIWNDKWIPIELKYKTKKFSYTDNDGCLYDLKNQGAQDYGCYDYIKDIYRIEHIKEKKPDLFLVGYAIFLTNDMFYYNGEVSDDTCYYKFRINQDRNINGTLNWQNTRKGTHPKTTKKRESSITISGDYTMSWDTYTNHPTTFMYLKNTIERRV